MSLDRVTHVQLLFIFARSDYVASDSVAHWSLSMQRRCRLTESHMCKCCSSLRAKLLARAQRLGPQIFRGRPAPRAWPLRPSPDPSASPTLGLRRLCCGGSFFVEFPDVFAHTSDVVAYAFILLEPIRVLGRLLRSICDTSDSVARTDDRYQSCERIEDPSVPARVSLKRPQSSLSLPYVSDIGR